jgi:predicted TIM-barrel fold metal-dependent hydrolase
MNNYFGKIINTHVHIYPEAIASKATEAIGKFYDIPMDKVGTEETMLKEIKEFGINHLFLLSTATVPKQVRHINDFLISLLQKHGRDKFTAFGTVHHLTEDIEGEMEYLRKNGITGIKFHHDFMGIAADDPAFDKIYEIAQANSTPVYFHTGDSRYPYTNPQQMLSIREKFPDLIIIAAHFGGYSVWEDAAKEFKDANFYYDTSSSLFELPPERATELIREMGVEKFFFATDFPMWDFAGEWERFSKLSLTDEEFDKIVHLNAENFIRKVRKNDLPSFIK